MRILNLSKYNGLVYPEIPGHLSTLDLISERLISPRIPFMQIRRSRHVLGQFGILGKSWKWHALFLSDSGTLPQKVGHPCYNNTSISISFVADEVERYGSFPRSTFEKLDSVKEDLPLAVLPPNATGADAQWPVFPIERTESPKVKWREIKQPTIYGPNRFPSHMVNSFCQYANGNRQQLSV
ncbi:hypothetical protein TNCV_1147391 [Trichonephila clavipes]|nr:hypothetical protein TNCV_1147391 [Trichonephila clavipes]